MATDDSFDVELRRSSTSGAQSLGRASGSPSLVAAAMNEMAEELRRHSNPDTTRAGTIPRQRSTRERFSLADWFLRLMGRR